MLPPDLSPIITPAAIDATTNSGATFAPVARAAAQRGRAVPGAPGAPLGSSTLSASAPPDPARKQRSVLRRYELQEAAAELLKDNRVRWCGCVPTGETVTALYHSEHKSASYRGLAYCGGAWVCPLCASKIMARRAADLGAAVDKWHERGGRVYMITFTLRHQRGQTLAFLLQAMNDAQRDMRSSGGWARLASWADLAGTVGAREMTHGYRNGWHPHIHMLFFTRKSLSKDALTVLEGKLFHAWARCLKKYGLDATKEYGIDIKEADSAVKDYVTKCAKTWSISQEMVSQLTKEGRRGNRSPQQLLMLYARGDAYAGKLFKEYAAATRRKRPLFWSQGLREEIFGPNSKEETDEEILASETASAEEVVELTREQWSRIVRYRLRGDLLASVLDCDKPALVEWLRTVGINLASWQLRGG